MPPVFGLLVIVLAVLAVLILLTQWLAKYVPLPYRRHGWGQSQQAVDHKMGRFGGSYHEEVVRAGGMPAQRQSRQGRTSKIGRNATCPCASGKKFKRCCGAPAR